MQKLSLKAVHDLIAHDPFGKPNPHDLSARPVSLTGKDGVVRLCAARNGYISFRLLVQGRGGYRLSTQAAGGLQFDLFKAWYHRMQVKKGKKQTWWPDALVPVRAKQTFRLPDADNRIPGQTTQEFWVDVYVPRDARPGLVKCAITLESNGSKTALPIQIEVITKTIPAEPSVIMDHNSYGCRWLAEYYPKLFAQKSRGKEFWRQCIKLLQHHFRLVHEHRGLFHNLGYTHPGAHDPIYGPRTQGRGRDKTLVDWELHDRYYGPLFDGSAFAAPAPGQPRPRRAATPLWGAYSALTPDWPASYLWWGEKGYETEFKQCVSQYDSHFRKKGWTQTRLEFYLNHKKRYRWYEWDGDEAKFQRDLDYHYEIVRMWESAIKGSPVKWVYRQDASWQLKNQFRTLKSKRNFWVCSGFYRWYPKEVRQVMDRGELAFWYNGNAPVGSPAGAVLGILYETWAAGLNGNCQWLSTGPGPDPWFHCDGAETGSIYPGERFGIAGPIPSIRMKVLRNGLQDIDLVNQSAARKGSHARVRKDVAKKIRIPVWLKPPQAARELPPEAWDNYNLGGESEPIFQAKKALDPLWWLEIRDRALGQEVKHV